MKFEILNRSTRCAMEVDDMAVAIVAGAIATYKKEYSLLALDIKDSMGNYIVIPLHFNEKFELDRWCAEYLGARYDIAREYVLYHRVPDLVKALSSVSLIGEKTEEGQWIVARSHMVAKHLLDEKVNKTNELYDSLFGDGETPNRMRVNAPKNSDDSSRSME